MKIQKRKLTYLTEIKCTQSFSELYIAVRDREHRILTEEQVLSLPKVSTENPYFSEWIKRQKSANRFINYLKQKKTGTTVLDLGCGNGWFSNLIALHFPSFRVVGIDINEFELKQANKIFQRENLFFVFGNIFKLPSKSFVNEFDIIVLNASVQYFKDFKCLISKLHSFLKPNGEIHIMDSPFYENKELLKAKLRTNLYFKKLGFQEMAKHYFHHCYNDISRFKILYKPKWFYFIRSTKGKDSTFRWVMMSIK